MSQTPIDDLVQELQNLKVREKEIVGLLEQRGLRPTDIEASAEKRPYVYYFKVGDRVRIANRLYSKSTLWPPPKEDDDPERLATVTKVDIRNDRVYIRTDSGRHTFRISSNLIRLNP
jgi:predicted RNA-binding protein (virulence factor B family)